MGPSSHGRYVRCILVCLIILLMNVAGTIGPADAFGIFGTKWPPGPVLGTPGAVSFSVMPAGLNMAGDMAGHGHSADLGMSTNFGALITLGPNQDELVTVQAAFATWASVTQLTNLGTVADNAALFNSPPADPRGGMGPFGDIRLAATAISAAGELAHAHFPPPSFGVSAPGDIHFNNALVWSDDLTDTNADLDVDFRTVALHELGHSLGLLHTAVPNSVMNPFYGGARRTLGTDDMLGIQEIYGPRGLPPCVPPPSAYAAQQHSYPGFNINNPRHLGFPTCDPLRPFSSHSFGSIFEGDIEITGELLHVVALADTNVEIGAQIGNVFMTEITQLDINRTLFTEPLFEGVPLPPNVIIRQDPDRRSLGQIELDGLKLTSYFDIFTEMSIDGGQTFVDSIGSTRMETSFTFVPEPSTWLLLGTGFFGLLGFSRRCRKRV